MDLVNEHRHLEATITRSTIPGVHDKLAASVVAKCRLDVATHTLTPVAPRRHSEGPPQSCLPDDLAPRKGEVDVFVHGTARFGSSRREHRVSLTREKTGASVDLLIRGDRSWERRSGGFVATDPLPLDSVPLDWSHAYGGKTYVDEGVPLPYFLNPHGTGFVVHESEAEGVRLPNLEDPSCELTHPTEAVLPFSFAPHVRAAMFTLAPGPDGRPRGTLDPLEHRQVSLRPMRFERLEAGERLGIVGLARVVTFEVPILSAALEIWTERRRTTLPFVLDTVGIDLDHETVELVLRACFTYAARPGELRLARLVSS